MASTYTWMSSLSTDCTALATCGSNSNNAQLPGSSSPQSPFSVLLVQTRQILCRIMDSNSAKERPISASFPENRVVHAEVHVNAHLSYWILQRFEEGLRFSGDIGAGIRS